MRSLFALSFLTPVFLSGATIEFAARDFASANWTQVNFNLTTLGTATNAQILSGGNPGAYRQLNVTSEPVLPGQSFTANIASFGIPFVYNPSLGGALLSLNFQYDIIEISKQSISFPAATYRPLLRQNSTLYFLNVEDVVATSWTTFARTGLSSANWLASGGGNPDFSSSGAPIQFGYRAFLTASCTISTTCPEIEAVTGLDNFVVTLTTEDPPNQIPEPSTAALLIPVALLLVLRHRAQ
jgi:hypothetical protein